VTPAIVVQGLTYRYPKGSGLAALSGIDLTVARGSRTLLVGRNGAGKSTLLRLMAGKRMVGEQPIRVLGRAAFHDTSLSRDVCYLGPNFPFDVDLRVRELMASRPHADAGRRDELIELLGVDLEWHMHQVSDGQRRRVQLLLGLLAPAEVMLLDEVTIDLDLLARARLLDFLHRESDQRGATILYATHILDALDGWLTHVVFMEAGQVLYAGPLDEIPALRQLRTAGVPAPLYRLIHGWLSEPASALP
jgi:CCR4-NOT complex subunit CAF16